MLFDCLLSFIVAFCWGILFGTPRRVLWIAGALGGVGHSIRTALLAVDGGLVSSTLIASLTVGILGLLCAYRIHQPPVVFTVPACITMIPGLYAYRSIIGAIKLSDLSGLSSSGNKLNIIVELAYNTTLTFSLLFTLAVGISISALVLGRKDGKLDLMFNSLGKKLKAFSLFRGKEKSKK